MLMRKKKKKKKEKKKKKKLACFLEAKLPSRLSAGSVGIILGQTGRTFPKKKRELGEKIQLK